MSTKVAKRPPASDDETSTKNFPIPFRALGENFIGTVHTALGYLQASLPLVIIFLLLLPVLFLISLSAGWIVRKSVPVGWKEPVYLQYGDGNTPFAYFALPQLVSDQSYDVSVQLVVPLTDTNVALGNFMTSLTLTTSSNKTVAYSRRPAVLHPRAPGFISRKKYVSEINILLLEAWVPGTSESLTGYVEIGRKDSWTSLGNGGGREITVAEAFVHGDVRLKGTRAVISSYPNISTLVASSIFFVISMLGVSACLIPFLSAPTRPPPSYKPSALSDPVRPRRRSRIKFDVPQPTIRTTGSDSEQDGLRRRGPATPFPREQFSPIRDRDSE